MTERPYYSYVLYLRAEPNRNLVAEAEAIALRLLKRHRLLDAATSKTWDRTAYTRVATGLITAVESPLDQLSLPGKAKRKRGKHKSDDETGT